MGIIKNVQKVCYHDSIRNIKKVYRCLGLVLMFITSDMYMYITVINATFAPGARARSCSRIRMKKARLCNTGENNLLIYFVYNEQ